MAKKKKKSQDFGSIPFNPEDFIGIPMTKWQYFQLVKKAYEMQCIISPKYFEKKEDIMACKKAILDGKFEGLLDAFQPPLAYKLKKQGDVITAHPYYSALLPAVNEIAEDYIKLKAKYSKLNADYNKLREELESKIADLKKESDEMKKENKILINELKSYKNSLQAYEGHPTLFNPKEAIFRWRNSDGELIIAPIARPILKAISDDTIDDYKIGMAKDGTVIFKKDFYVWKESEFPILEGYLSTLKESVKKAINDGKLDIENVELKNNKKLLIETVKEKHPLKDDFADIEKIIYFLDEKEFKLTTDIRKNAKISRQDAHYNLEKILLKDGIVEKRDLKKGTGWRLKPSDGS